MGKEQLRVGICDDREEDIDRIEGALRSAVEENRQAVSVLCSRFLDGESLYETSRKEKFDLFFLDIEMPGVDGFKLAARLCMDRPQPRLVFVSIHESFVFDSPRYMPLWFVRKSMLERDMYKAMRMFFHVTAQLEVSYRLKGGFGSRNLLAKDILYIECSGHSLSCRLADGGILERHGSLKPLEEELAEYRFLRIHKNYLVNQEYIKEVGRREVYLSNGETLEMGRDRRPLVRKAMLQYEREQNENWRACN